MERKQVERDISTLARLHLAGPAKPHTFLWCNAYLMVTFELQLQWKEQEGNSDPDLREVK